MSTRGTSEEGILQVVKLGRNITASQKRLGLERSVQRTTADGGHIPEGQTSRKGTTHPGTPPKQTAAIDILSSYQSPWS